MANIGLDLGTKHIVVAYREGQKVKYRYEINGYIIFERHDQFLEQLLIRNNVPFVRRGEQLIAIGEKAEQLAFSFNKTLKRPMAEGGVSKDDDDAQEIMAIIIKSIIGELNEDTVLYYCTTAAPINNQTLNIEFHKKVVKLLVEKYVSNNKITANHINEARCIVIEEPDCSIGISWGAGTVTVHAGIFGVPIFEFCVVGAGDYIDIEAAKRFGYDPNRPDANSRETPTTICRLKEKLDLNVLPEDKVGQTIFLFYELLVENVINGIIDGINANRDKFRFDKPVPIINAGGTSMPNGFIELVQRKLATKKDDLHIQVGEVRRAKEPLFAVAHGCLIASELHKKG